MSKSPANPSIISPHTDVNHESSLRVAPPHLTKISWIAFEATIALEVRKGLNKELKLLRTKFSTGHVHNSRIALRRWFTIMEVLEEDGWTSKTFQRKINKPLRKLLKALGKLRDTDVNMQLGQRLGCPNELLETWAKVYKKQTKQAKKYAARLDTKKLLADLKDYLLSKQAKLGKPTHSGAKASATYKHISEHISKQETYVQKLSQDTLTPESLHLLRLAIKKWRYLLTEFFGLTNLELTKAQQLLGQIHDADRLTPLLEQADNALYALKRLRTRREELLNEFVQLQFVLPYGLRPSVTTPKTLRQADF